MQILRKTKLKALKKARKIGSLGIIKTLKDKNILGRGGASFPTWKKWEIALNSDSEEKYLICNADEGEPGTFKDRFIIKNNTETLIEGILIAAYIINAKKAFIYLRGEYEYLRLLLQRSINKVQKQAGLKLNIEIIVGAGAYVCGDETAIIESIEGRRGHPYYKPPYPTLEGLFGKPTVIDNVETLTCAAQAILYDDYDSSLRLFSLSGNIENPGVYELPIGTNMKDILRLVKPKNNIKAVYFGCFGGCMPYEEIEINEQNICGRNCVIGTYTLIFIDEKQPIIELAESIARFYEHESCGKCTPCREGTKRILDLVLKIKEKKATRDDLHTLEYLADHIHQTSLCGLGQTATNHILTALRYFRHEFEEMLNENLSKWQ